MSKALKFNRRQFFDNLLHRFRKSSDIQVGSAQLMRIDYLSSYDPEKSRGLVLGWSESGEKRWLANQLIIDYPASGKRKVFDLLALEKNILDQIGQQNTLGQIIQSTLPDEVETSEAHTLACLKIIGFFLKENILVIETLD